MHGAVGCQTWGEFLGSLDCHLSGKDPAAEQDRESHPGITRLSASLQGLGEAGLGLEAEPRQLVRMGCYLHPSIAPLLSGVLPGFWGLVGDVGTKRGSLAPRQGAREKGKPAGRGSLHWMPAGVLGKKSSCSAYAVETGQESSHATSHWADFSGC